MRIICEERVSEFVFWGGAKDSRERFTYEEMDQLNDIFEDLYGDEGLTDTQLNDIMWFEPEVLCEWLGIDFDEWLERKL